MTTIAHDALDRVSHHPGGDCRCGEAHVSMGMHDGYSQCRRCRRLRALRGAPAPQVDHMAALRRAREKFTVKHGRRSAVEYLRCWLSLRERQWIRQHDLDDATWGDIDLASGMLATRAILALKAAGIYARSMGLKVPIKDLIVGFLEEAAGR